jgi:hypothetical protein
VKHPAQAAFRSIGDPATPKNGKSGAV